MVPSIFPLYVPPMLWHAHEMLFGFVASAIAGFLLTAVPSWTGEKGFAGRPLMILAGIWLAPRLLIATSELWPAFLIGLVDLAFIPALIALVARPLLRLFATAAASSRGWRLRERTVR